MVEVPPHCKARPQPTEKRTGGDENKTLPGIQAQQMEPGPIEFR
jgi:hypothetical protein